jgi:putative holliday junction resolvase
VGAILGIDVGDRRVGIAVADAGQRIAVPLRTVERAQGNAEREILALVAERRVELIVAGLPLGEHDEETPQSERVRQFCRRLSRRSSVEIRFHDEWGSSIDAEQRLLQLRGKRSRIEKAEIDAYAAALILNSFLEAQRAIGGSSSGENGLP